MTPINRLRNAKRLLAVGISCALLLTVPACRIPNPMVGDAGPTLPPNFSGLTVVPGVQTLPPTVIPTGGTAVIPAGGKSAAAVPPVQSTGGTTIVAASGSTIIAGHGAIIIPAGQPTGSVVTEPTLVPAGGQVEIPAVPAANAPAKVPPIVPMPPAKAPGADVPAKLPASLPAAPASGVPAMMPTVSPAVPVAGCAENSAQLGYSEFYNDPLLTRLIQKALADNRELKNLELEIQIAATEVLARRGAYLPLATIGGGSGFEKTSKLTRNGAVEDQLLLPPRFRTFPDPLPNTRIGIDVLWNLDIWRLYRNARDAAIQRYYAAIERRNDFITRLIADVAQNYYGLMAIDRRMENLDQTITLQQQSLEAAKARVEAVRGNELPVQRFQAEVRRNQSEKLILRQEIVELENRINYLLNRYPEPVERSSAGFDDLTIRALSVGIPSQLLQNRPDIRQAERELAAAGLDVKVARARFFPQLSITAGIGFEAFNPRYIFNPEAFAANLAGNLVAPLVNRTAIQAEYLSANARQLEALYNYQRITLNAFTELVNRVNMAENYRRGLEVKKQQLDALETSVEIATKLYMNARGEYTEVLFVQRDLRDARMGFIDTKRQQLTAVVNAYQALGGGSTSLPIPAPIVPITGQSKYFWRR